MMNMNPREASLYVIIVLAAICLWCLCGRKMSGYTHESLDVMSKGHAGSNLHSNTHAAVQQKMAQHKAMMRKAPAHVSNIHHRSNTHHTGGIIGMSPDEQLLAEVDYTGTPITKEMGCAVNSGVGLSSSLLPRTTGAVEQFGEFAPDDILKGQNFLNVRNQIGFPETLGGAIRNGNQQLRAEMPNPKQPFVWNNSTIVPDLMQRPLCT